MLRSKRKITCLILALALILSSSATVFAATPQQVEPASDISPQNIADVAIEFWRTSSTGASSIVSSTTFATAEYIKSSVTLQKYNTSTNSWSNVGSARVNTVYNTSLIYISDKWTLQTNTTYRLKVVMTDRCDSITTTVTIYSYSI